MRDLTYRCFGDILSHVRGLIAHKTSKSERRQRRMQVLDHIPDCAVYFSDGASRIANDIEERRGSYGAIVLVNGTVLGRVAVYLGDVSNNEAEYEGVVSAIGHAVTAAPRACCFRVDSLLVARQLRGEWACRAPHLVPTYTRCLQLLERLRAHVAPNTVRVQHIYREYNGDADGLANYALDQYNSQRHPNGIVCNQGWVA